MNQERQKALLLLQDGTLFEGYAVGINGTSYGEICFNTGMTGYQEVFTDPSYFGQIIIMTSPHIGNYGTLDSEVESDNVKISGLVSKSFSQIHSRTSTDQDLQSYFEKNKIVGIDNIDTRQLVRHIRSKGAMNAIISSTITDIDELKRELDKSPSMEGLELSSRVTTEEPYVLGENNDGKKIAVLDYGIKRSILTNLIERGCVCKVFPSKTSFEELSSWNPDGYFLSNGPGDPSVMNDEVNTVKEILNTNKPIFGICLGHQILSRANGISTFKMHHGHRGLNHPVKNLKTNRGEITSQNHGFAVKYDEVVKHKDVELTHVNLNDDTVEGIRVKSKNAFSVQYHPESSPGPHDSRYLFDDFVKMLNANVVENELN